MLNKVTFGLQNVHVAFMQNDTPTYDAPIPIPGAVRFTGTPQGEKSTFYADNGPYFVTESNNGYTAELEMALVPHSVLAQMLGWELDDNDMLVEVTKASPKHFALMFQVEGDSKNRRSVYYDCVASRPTREERTKGETTTPNPDVLQLTIIPVEIGGRKVVKGVMELGETNASAYNAFFDAVTVPDATPAAVTKTLLAATIAIAAELDEADWSTGTWASLQTALTGANSVYGDEEATQQGVNAANAALQAAILALVPDS